jgi:hypothetical protein
MPEREFGIGPNALWRPPTEEDLLIECRSGCTTTEISKTDLGQLGQSTAWFTEVCPGRSLVAVVIHPSRRAGPGGTAADGMRAMTFTTLAKLCGRVRDLATAVGGYPTFDPAMVNEQLVARDLHAAGFGTR